MGKLGDIFGRVRPITDGFARRSIPTYAAACTFYMFLSLPSVVILVCSILPMTTLSQDVLLDLLESAVPDHVFSLVTMLVEGVYSSSLPAFSLSVILTLWSAALGIASLMRGLRSAYLARKKANYIWLRLRAVLYIVIFVAALIMSLALLVFGQQLSAVVLNLLPAGDSWMWLKQLLKFGRHLVSFAVLFVVFLLMYRFGSDAGLKLWQHIYGALFASLGWIVLSAVFSGITSITARYSIYGILGTVIASMLWLYYCVYILLVGGYLNSLLAEGHGQ